MRRRLAVLAACLFAALVAVPASAAGACDGLPKHTPLPVVDTAKVVRPQQLGYLAADLVRYHVDGHAAIVAATVPNLGGDDVSSYAHRLFGCWGIGDADSDNGVLILVAMREHRVRIELGAGLSNRLGEDDLDRAIATMTAPLRAGDVGGALRSGAASVAEALGTPLPDTEHDAAGATPPPDQVDDVTDASGDATQVPSGTYVDTRGFGPFDDSGGGSGAFALVPVAIVIGLVGTVVSAVRRGVGGGSTWGNGPGGTWPGGGSRYGGMWGGGTMLHRGMWNDAPFGGSSGSAGMSSGGSSGMSSSGGGGSFGGGSGGGGGASGSW